MALGSNRRAPDHCSGFEDVVSTVWGAALSLALGINRRAPEDCLGLENVVSMV